MTCALDAADFAALPTLFASLVARHTFGTLLVVVDASDGGAMARARGAPGPGGRDALRRLGVLRRFAVAACPACGGDRAALLAAGLDHAAGRQDRTVLLAPRPLAPPAAAVRGAARGACAVGAGFVACDRGAPVDARSAAAAALGGAPAPADDCAALRAGGLWRALEPALPRAAVAAACGG